MVRKFAIIEEVGDQLGIVITVYVFSLFIDNPPTLRVQKYTPCRIALLPNRFGYETPIIDKIEQVWVIGA